MIFYKARKSYDNILNSKNTNTEYMYIQLYQKVFGNKSFIQQDLNQRNK